eukprot:gene2814-3499_t
MLGSMSMRGGLISEPSQNLSDIHTNHLNYQESNGYQLRDYVMNKKPILSPPSESEGDDNHHNHHPSLPAPPQQQHLQPQQHSPQQTPQQLASSEINPQRFNLSMPPDPSTMAGVYGNYSQGGRTSLYPALSSFPALESQPTQRYTSSPQQWPQQRMIQTVSPLGLYYPLPTHSMDTPAGYPSYGEPPAIHDVIPQEQKLPHLHFYSQQSTIPAHSGAPSLAMTQPSASVFEGIKIDLYHKPRGSKGTWMPIFNGDHIRVTEGKGKRLKMIVYCEQELYRVGLQVALLDLQETGTHSRRGSTSSSLNSSSSSSPSVTSTNSSSHSSSSSSSSSPSSLSNSSTLSPPAQNGLNSSTNSSPSPSSFSLSSPSPSHSPSNSPSQTTSPIISSSAIVPFSVPVNSSISPFSISISVTPPSPNPAPAIPTGPTSSLPAADPQGLTVESVRVYRYSPTAQVPVSTLEFELKLAKLSKRLCIVMAALSKEGRSYEGKTVEFFAHNNGKHNANSMVRNNMRRNTGPYQHPSPSSSQSSPSITSYQQQDMVNPNLPISPLVNGLSGSSNSILNSPTMGGSGVVTGSPKGKPNRKLKAPTSPPNNNPPLPSLPPGITPLPTPLDFQTTGHPQPPMHWHSFAHHPPPHIEGMNSWSSAENLPVYINSQHSYVEDKQHS